MLLTKFKTILLLGVSALVLTGCGHTPLPEQQFKKEVMIEKNSDGTTRFFGLSPVLTGFKNTANLISELKEAAHYGKHHDYKFFAIKSSKFNNVLGLPVTTINDIMRYCSYPTTDATARNAGDCDGLQFRTDVYYFKENPNAFPVWSVDAVINEKIDLTYIKKIKSDRKKLLTDYLDKRNISYIQ